MCAFSCSLWFFLLLIGPVIHDWPCLSTFPILWIPLSKACADKNPASRALVILKFSNAEKEPSIIHYQYHTDYYSVSSVPGRRLCSVPPGWAWIEHSTARLSSLILHISNSSTKCHKNVTCHVTHRHYASFSFLFFSFHLIIIFPFYYNLEDGCKYFEDVIKLYPFCIINAHYFSSVIIFI